MKKNLPNGRVNSKTEQRNGSVMTSTLSNLSNSSNKSKEEEEEKKKEEEEKSAAMKKATLLEVTG